MAYVHKINHFGQVVIPASFRKQLGLSEGNYVNLQLTDEGILIHPLSTEQSIEVTIPDVLQRMQTRAQETKTANLTIDEINQIVERVRARQKTS